MYLFYLCIIGHNMLYSKKELPRHSENFRDRQFFFVLQNHMSWANFPLCMETYKVIIS